MNRPQTSNFLNSNESKNFFLTTSNYINDITNINNTNANNSKNNNLIQNNNYANNTSSQSNSDSGKNSSSNSDSPPSFRPKSVLKQKTNRITTSISSNEQHNDSDSFKEIDADSVRDSNVSNSPRQMNDHDHEQDHDQLDLDLQEKENFYSLNRQDPTRSLSSPVQQLQLITDQYNPTKVSTTSSP